MKKPESTTAVAAKGSARAKSRAVTPSSPEAPPLMAIVQRRISAIKADRLKDLQLRLFPELPDDRRRHPTPSSVHRYLASLGEANGRG